MLSNYLKVALRNLVRFRTYSIINICGLAVGITCFLILTLFILDELSFDRFYRNADHIYRIYVRQAIEAGMRYSEAGKTLSVEEVRAKFGLKK